MQATTYEKSAAEANGLATIARARYVARRKVDIEKKDGCRRISVHTYICIYRGCVRTILSPKDKFRASSETFTNHAMIGSFRYGVPVAKKKKKSIYVYLVAIIAHAVAVRWAVEGAPLTFRRLTSPQLKMICLRKLSLGV